MISSLKISEHRRDKDKVVVVDKAAVLDRAQLERHMAVVDSPFLVVGDLAGGMAADYKVAVGGKDPHLLVDLARKGQVEDIVEDIAADTVQDPLDQDNRLLAVVDKQSEAVVELLSFDLVAYPLEK